MGEEWNQDTLQLTTLANHRQHMCKTNCSNHVTVGELANCPARNSKCTRSYLQPITAHTCGGRLSVENNVFSGDGPWSGSLHIPCIVPIMPVAAASGVSHDTAAGNGCLHSVGSSPPALKLRPGPKSQGLTEPTRWQICSGQLLSTPLDSS